MPDKPPGSIILRSESVSVRDLEPYYRNARRHADENLQESLTELGQYRRIVVNIGTKTGRPMEILAGNGTHANAVAIGQEFIDVDLVDVDGQTASKIVLEDNRGNDLAFLLGYDTDILLEELGELDTLTATGWTEEDIARMITPPEDEPDEDDDPIGGNEFGVIVTARDRREQDRLLAQFDAEGLACRPLQP